MGRKKIDIRLGQLLIQKQWCTLRQITEALEFQNSQRSGGGPRGLGRILVGRGILDEDRLMQSLAELGELVLSCSECGRKYSVQEYDNEMEYTCTDCRKELSLGEAAPGESLTPYVPTPKAPPQTAAPAAAEADASAETDRGKAAAEPPKQTDSFVGKVLGGCKLVERVASGGMGVIYKAQQLNLNRTVAVKVLSRELSDDESFVRRFIEEARSAAQLNHGNIVHINDVGDYHGIFYFTMEYVDGVNLKKLFKEQSSLPIDRALEVTRQVCAALQHAHKRGIIHRDIKPENIMITRDGIVKLADLGLAKKVTPTGVDDLTEAGSILGTPFYMAPEQAKDFSHVDERSDIYSLGVTLFKMLTGTVPFQGRTPIEVMIKAIEGNRPDLRSLREDVPREVQAIVDRMMQKNPEDRYQSVDDLIDDLEQVLGDTREGNLQSQRVSELNA